MAITLDGSTGIILPSSASIDNVDSIKATSTLIPTIKSSSGASIATFCRAWVKFNGAGTISISGSFNVTSITDNGIGDYTVNLTNAVEDANFCALVSATGVVNASATAAHLNAFLGSPGSDNASAFVSSSAFRFSIYKVLNSAHVGDPAFCTAAIFR